MPVPTMAQTTDRSAGADTSFFTEGESLLYEASWAGIKIGSIRLETLRSSFDSGATRRRAVAHIDSYAGIPFVNLHFTAFSEMDSAFNSIGSRSQESDGKKREVIIYKYDLQKKFVISEEMIRENRNDDSASFARIDTISLPSVPIQDGISLVFFARRLVRFPGSTTVPTLSYQQVGETVFDPDRSPSTISIDEWEQSISVIKISGKLKLKGIFGLTGDFKGWFSDDAAVVPIAAEMKVILGSITIELKDWKRNGWNPPK